MIEIIMVNIVINIIYILFCLITANIMGLLETKVSRIFVAICIIIGVIVMNCIEADSWKIVSCCD